MMKKRKVIGNMRHGSLYRWWSGEKEKMSGLSAKGKVEYLWEYYKYHALAIIGILIIIGFVIYGQIYNHREVIISGIFLNTDTSEEGYRFLSDDYLRYTSSNDGQRADVIETLTIKYEQTEPYSDNASQIMYIDALISSRSLDYMIVDETALQFYGASELCLDLNEVLTSAQRSTLKDKLVSFYSTESEQEYSLAIDLTGSEFAERYGLTARPSYLVFICNTPRISRIPDFLEYFLGLE